jgi:predicted RND superfamily exporter protein
MYRISSVLARWIVRRPLLVALVGLLLAAVSAKNITSQTAFDSDILNLLPADDIAVRGLKIFNSEFTQARELAFLLVWKERPADADLQREAFLALLRKEPWVERILEEPPLESVSGRKTLHEILIPLLLNLPPEQFAAAMDDLAPGAIRARIDRLSAQTAAGSPRARLELENDPLGLAARAARPVWDTVAISETFNLTSTDGAVVIVPVITNQSDLSAEACRVTMREVRRFVAEAKRELGAEGPEIGVTGRSAYVEEIEQSMQRDIATTSLVSLLCVTALFWVGFRQLLPLIGIALLLALTALMTLALGQLFFAKLNIIAISFCSILFGLGDDFSLLLYQRFFHSRNAGMEREAAIADSIRHCEPGILSVALTTGAGFLALWFIGSSGFAQLGVLVAVGLLLCAVLMPAFLFLFVRDSPSAAASAGPARTFVRQCLRSPTSVLKLATLLFLTCAILSIIPWRSLRFDISPTSLEPRNLPAAKTLALMMQKFPATFEPVMIVLPSSNPSQLEALDKLLKRLKEERLIETSSSPSALVLNPARMRANRHAAVLSDLTASRNALKEALEAAGLNASAFSDTFTVLDTLKQELPGEISWGSFLSTASPWWFLFDRLISPASGAVIAYARTPQEITGEQREQITKLVTSHLPGSLVTGWSQALATLTARAYGELLVFGGAVSLVILLILGILYRDSRLWLVHTVALLGAAAGTIATLKLMQVSINLLNVLAFPLMIGVGVDYGTHIILAAKQRGDLREDVPAVLKPIVLSGLTTATGFGSLMLAQNAALSGLGTICGIGVAWCLLASLLIVTPGAVIARRMG